MQSRIKYLPLFILAYSLLASASAGAAQTSASDPAFDSLSGQAPAAETTLAIFPDPKAKPMPDELWEDLVAALRKELISGEPETRSLSVTTPANTSHSGTHESASDQSAASSESLQPEVPLQILRGDKIVSGILVDKFIAVYLVGECKVTPTPQLDPFHPVTISGALGWVNVTDGQIQPFIHVDCKRIGQMLGLHAMGLSVDQRQRQMANAIARVILHEWIHIATQNPHHAKHGIAKAEFSINDLLAHPAKPSVRPTAQTRNGD